MPEKLAHPVDPSLSALGLASGVALAPMAGITDLPMRNLVQRFGAGLVVSEMVASREMVEAKRSVRDRAELGVRVEGTSVQIAGREAHWMSEAARLLEGQGARLIDINMGCPAKKVVGGASGSALLRDHDHALSLIAAVVDAVNVPVTLKTRLGWDDDSKDTAALARRAEDAGIRMLVIHGRTRCQFYKGHADWRAVREIVDAVTIPVLVNGDITDTKTAREALAQSGAAGVMVGRGIQGRPWTCTSIAADLGQVAKPDVPTGAALADMVLGHYDAMLGFYGPHGARAARKHLGWYMDDAGTDAHMRRRILTAEPADVMAMIPDALSCEKRSAA